MTPVTSVAATMMFVMWAGSGASGSADSWTDVVGCLEGDDAAKCVRQRAVKAMENLLPESDEKDLELPKGVSPSVAKIIDRLGEMIASSVFQWYPEEDEQSPNSLDEGKRNTYLSINQIRMKLTLTYRTDNQ